MVINIFVGRTGKAGNTFVLHKHTGKRGSSKSPRRAAGAFSLAEIKQIQPPTVFRQRRLLLFPRLLFLTQIVCLPCITFFMIFQLFFLFHNFQKISILLFLAWDKPPCHIALPRFFTYRKPITENTTAPTKFTIRSFIVSIRPMSR